MTIKERVITTTYENRNALIFACGSTWDEAEQGYHYHYSDMLAGSENPDDEFVQLIKGGIATDMWYDARYYLVRAESGEGFYPLPLVFATAEERNASAAARGVQAPSEEWVIQMRQYITDAVA